MAAVEARPRSATERSRRGVAPARRLRRGAARLERDDRPAAGAVVRCTGNADVIATIAFAREHGLPVSVRGGGHNVAGTAVATAASSSTSPRCGTSSVDVEQQTVRAGGGARLGDVDHETQAFGLATPFGVVSQTGIGGLTLHGGMGFLTRRLGLSCDNLIAADVVTADGRLVHTDAERNPELLWALRGGGGNFGAVTSLEYRLHAVGPEVFMAITFYPAEAGADGLPRVPRDLRERAGRADGRRALLDARRPRSRSRPSGTASRCSSPPAAGRAARGRGGGGQAAARARDAGRRPERADAVPRRAEPLRSRIPRRAPLLLEVDVPLRGRTAEAELLGRYAASRPSPLSSIDVWALGGAMRNEPDGGSAFAQRDAPFLLGVEANWDDPADDEANITWARELIGEASDALAGRDVPQLPRLRRGGRAAPARDVRRELRPAAGGESGVRPGERVPEQPEQSGQTMIGTVPPSALQAAPVT